MYRIELINKKTKQVIKYDDVVDLNDGEKMFFKFQINTKQLDDGEYTLNLYDDDTLIKTDTLNVGDFNAKALQYKRGEDIYVETKIDVQLNNKFVELNEINSTIYPDDGIDGMLSVTVDATPLYNRGVEDGVNEQKNRLTSISITENDTYINEDGYNEITVDVQPNLQEKYVNVTDNNTTVTADEEFDGMKSVEINATPIYNNGYNDGKSDGVEQGYNNGYNVGSTEGYNNGVQVGYNDGYATGKAEGITTQRDLMTTLSVRSNGLWRRDDGYNEVDVNVESFSYLTNTVDVEGLSELGWSDDDINYYKDNSLHYEWQNKDYIVSQGNKEIVINSVDDVRQNINNPDFEYCPYFDSSNEQYSRIFQYCKYLKSIPLLNTTRFTSLSNAFDGCANLQTIPPINTENVTNMYSTFRGCLLLQYIPLLNTEKVTDISYAFDECKSIQYIPHLNTEKVTNMGNTFRKCISLKSIPHLNTENVTYMGRMFQGCEVLTTIPLLKTSNVTNMEYIFENCINLNNVPLLDTSNVTSLQNAFSGCNKLTTIPQFNTSKVTRVEYMFSNCNQLISLPLLDFSSVQYIGYFFGFSNMTNLINLGGFKDLKVDWKGSGCLSYAPNLTKESVLNVINHLYNFRENGDSTTTKTINLHKNSLALLSDDEKAIATAKGWVLAS